MSELRRSRDTFKEMNLKTLKNVRDAFERDLERKVADKDYCVARIAMLNGLILERLVDEQIGD